MSKVAKETHESDFPWVIFFLNKELYAISSEKVISMEVISKIVTLPNAPPYIRGMIPFRDSIVPMLDLRVRLGMPSGKSEIDAFCAMLTQREHDHFNWVHELERSVEEKRPFTLTTDPRKCAFGQWYYSYQTENITLRTLIKRFEQPHQLLHQTAEQVVELETAGKLDEVSALIQKLREGPLAILRALFDETRKAVSEQREIAMICDVDGHHVALTVDNIDSIDRIVAVNDDGTAMIINRVNDSCIIGSARCARAQRPLMLIDVMHLADIEKIQASIPNA